MTTEVTVDVTFADATVEEFEHPDGSTGIMAGIRTSTAELSDEFRIGGDVDDTPTVTVFRRNTDGVTNFEDYRENDDGSVTFTMTDEQYEELRHRYLEML